MEDTNLKAEIFNILINLKMVSIFLSKGLKIFIFNDLTCVLRIYINRIIDFFFFSFRGSVVLWVKLIFEMYLIWK